MIYNRNFFKRRVRRYHDREVTLAKIWHQYLKPTSVIDLGCGIGSYLAGFRQCGASVIGCEYGYARAKEFFPEEVSRSIFGWDLGERLPEAPSYELSMSIEVAEHLPEAAADNFCWNLVNTSHKYILLTAAEPGKSGVGHINCQPKLYWINKMEAYGCEYDPIRTYDMMQITQDLDLTDRVMVFVTGRCRPLVYGG